MTIRDIHANWAWVMIFANGAAGLWSLSAHWVAALRLRAMWWFVVAAELSIFVQVVMGVVMVAGLDLQAAQFHMFYGFVALITVALLFAYRQQLKPHLYLLYGWGSLFLMGLGIRAMLKGSVS